MRKAISEIASNMDSSFLSSKPISDSLFMLNYILFPCPYKSHLSDPWNKETIMTSLIAVLDVFLKMLRNKIHLRRYAFLM